MEELDNLLAFKKGKGFLSMFSVTYNGAVHDIKYKRGTDNMYTARIAGEVLCRCFKIGRFWSCVVFKDRPHNAIPLVHGFVSRQDCVRYALIATGIWS